MNKTKNARLFTNAVFVCIFGFLLSACKVGTDTPNDNSCKGDQTITKIQTLHANDTGNVTYFSLQSLPSKSSCEATYTFYFMWANPDSAFAKSRPPLNDLSTNFRPGGLDGLVSYFGHPVERLVESNPNFRSILFSVGNNNSGSDTTVYTVYATLKNGTPQRDSVRISAVLISASFAK